MRSLIRSRIRRDDAGAVIVLGRAHDGRPARHGRPRHRRRPALRRAPRAPERRRRRRAGGGPGLRRRRLPRRDDHRRHLRRRQRPRRRGRDRRGVRIRPRAPPVRHAPGGCPRHATGSKVTTVTPDDDKVDFAFAPILGHDAGTVDATAVAAWGAVGRATTLPLTFSECEFIELGGDVDAGTFPSGLNYIYFHDTTDAGTCPAGPSGADLPGGFGWLDSSDDCGVDVSADGWVDDKPGNGVPNDCEPSDWQSTEVLVPHLRPHERSQRLERHVPRSWLRRLPYVRLPVPRKRVAERPPLRHQSRRAARPTSAVSSRESSRPARSVPAPTTAPRVVADDRLAGPSPNTP